MKRFEMPEDIEPGRYILYVRVTYDGKVASASAWFNVKRKSPLTLKEVAYIVLGILAIFIIFLIARKSRKKRKSRIDEHALAKKKLIKRK